MRQEAGQRKAGGLRMSCGMRGEESAIPVESKRADIGSPFSSAADQDPGQSASGDAETPRELGACQCRPSHHRIAPITLLITPQRLTSSVFRFSVSLSPCSAQAADGAARWALARASELT
eukprot:3701050-Rhodomonas_salina.1